MSSEPSPTRPAEDATFIGTPEQSEEPAFVDPEQWVDHYGDFLYRYAVVRLRNSSEAEEAVQETFLSAIAGLSRYTGSGSQRGWLIGILRRKIVDTMRGRGRRRNASLEALYDPSRLLFDDRGKWQAAALVFTPPDTGLESQELWRLVRECLRQIAPAQADVFVLSVIDELSPEQICQELDISLSNMWVRLHRARLGLAKCLTGKWTHDQLGASGA